MPEQRSLLYRQEARRTGIHAPILAALFQVQQQPALADGETGLGIAPANTITLAQVDRFAAQVYYAANTLCHLINDLTITGWQGGELWDSQRGCYTDRLLETIAAGYHPPTSTPAVAILETCDDSALRLAYLEAWSVCLRQENLPADQSYVDSALLALVGQMFAHYQRLPYQRQALLEMVRLWRKLDTQEAAIASLIPQAGDEFSLDVALLQFLPQIVPAYAAYPHQREALLRLVQGWLQLQSREATIAALQQPLNLALDLDQFAPAWMALLQRIPQTYQARGEQRNALVEGYRLWRQLDSRTAVLLDLGVNPELFTAPDPKPQDLANAAALLDRALLTFLRRMPLTYTGLAHQQEALLQLTQLWRGIGTREQTLQSLVEDLQRLAGGRRDSPEAGPTPLPADPRPRPNHWTAANLQMFAAIVPWGSLTWADATRGGTYLPPNQLTVDTIVQMAELVQSLCDRLGRPITVTRWYCPAEILQSRGGVELRHSLGDAIEFYWDGLTGKQLYWFLDPWWPGGLGHYERSPYLCYIDAGSERSRWLK